MRAEPSCHSSRVSDTLRSKSNCERHMLLCPTTAGRRYTPPPCCFAPKRRDREGTTHRDPHVGQRCPSIDSNEGKLGEGAEHGICSSPFGLAFVEIGTVEVYFFPVNALDRLFLVCVGRLKSRSIRTLYLKFNAVY